MPTAVLTAEFDRLIRFGATQYSYYLRIRDDSATLRKLLAQLEADRFVLVTDRKVPVRYVARMRQTVAAVKIMRRMPLPYGLSPIVLESNELRSEKEPEAERPSASS